MSVLQIVVEVDGGATIEEITTESIALARRTESRVKFQFNGIFVSVSANASVHEVVSQYQMASVNSLRYVSV